MFGTAVLSRQAVLLRAIVHGCKGPVGHRSMDTPVAQPLPSSVMERATASEWDDEAFERILERLGSEGTIDAKGKHISAGRLERILAAAPKDPDHPERSIIKHAGFGRARFQGAASFDGMTFKGSADFANATFEATGSFDKACFECASFDSATFQRNVSFGEATFEGLTTFIGVSVQDIASFREARFQDDVWFGRATFNGNARFDGAEFESEAHFDPATFKAEAHFPKVTFRRQARFQDAVFGGFAHFPDATFCSQAAFRGADLKGGFRLGPAVVVGSLELDEASLGNVDIRVSTCLLSCKGTRFHDPAHLKLRWAEVHLDEGVFDRASTLALSPLWKGVDEAELRPCHGVQPGSDEVAEREEAGESPAMPRLISLRGADVANLTLADINLESCVFESALNLDQLRLATRCPFAKAPSGHFRSRHSIPFVWRWTRRMTICEEGTWRVLPWGGTTRRRDDWRTDWADVVTDCGSETISEPSAMETEARRRSEADRLAKIYRALRKGREDESNAPGAGDFYYGEMEMRRHGEASGLERTVIWLYWLVAGYGLRASRALVALALTVLLFALLFDWWGFRPDRDLGRTLLFSIESTSSLFRVPETRGSALTAGGEVLQVILRLLGPLFFGLALLSLRGRVKR